MQENHYGRLVVFLFLTACVVFSFVYFVRSRETVTSTDIAQVSAEETVAPTATPTPEPTIVLDPNDKLPDLLPMPAQDLKLQKAEDGRDLLLFSTTYYNQGMGTLELRADPKTKGIREDITRKVFQRIYLKDGGYREKEVGTFLWHQEHLHYHFSDFISYDLEAIDAPATIDLSGLLVKATFCLRDISKVFLDLPNKLDKAGYVICGKELQGVSVGWGDTYYWDYPAQNLNVSELASGTYKLTFKVNPEMRLDEMNYTNNVSSVTFKLDKENMKVSVVEQSPANPPEIEHIHLDEPFGNTPR